MRKLKLEVLGLEWLLFLDPPQAMVQKGTQGMFVIS